MEGNRRNYSEEFKKDAVQHRLTSEKTVVEVAQDLGIAHSNLRRWRTQYGKSGELAFPEMASKNLLLKKRKSEG